MLYVSFCFSFKPIHRYFLYSSSTFCFIIKKKSFKTKISSRAFWLLMQKKIIKTKTVFKKKNTEGKKFNRRKCVAVNFRHFIPLGQCKLGPVRKRWRWCVIRLKIKWLKILSVCIFSEKYKISQSKIYDSLTRS